MRNVLAEMWAMVARDKAATWDGLDQTPDSVQVEDPAPLNAARPDPGDTARPEADGGGQFRALDALTHDQRVPPELGGGPWRDAAK